MADRKRTDSPCPDLPVDGDIPVEDLIECYPKAIRFLQDRGIVCLTCGEPFWGPLKDLAMRQGYTESAFVVLLRELNEWLDKSVSE